VGMGYWGQCAFVNVGIPDIVSGTSEASKSDLKSRVSGERAIVLE
jgi:hypothetical protein